MKKILGLGTLALAGVLAFTGCGKDKGMTNEEAIKYAEEQGYVKADPALPAPRKAQTATGTKCTMDNAAYYGPDCTNVLLSENFWNYVGRDDSAYIDLRSDSEIVTNSAAGMGYIDGFQVIDYNRYIYGDGEQWFIKSTGSDNLMPRNENSVEMLEAVFPRDKNLFIMCAGGVRVTTMLQILELNGYDMSRVYNIGGSNHIAKAANKDELVAKYTFRKMTATPVFTTKGENAFEWVLREGMDDEDEGYTTYAHVVLDSSNKIASLYITGKVVSNTSAEWNAETWLANANTYAKKLVGKTKAEVEAMYGEDGATGADVVTGATASSNRVLRAVIDALA